MIRPHAKHVAFFVCVKAFRDSDYGKLVFSIEQFPFSIGIVGGISSCLLECFG